MTMLNDTQLKSCVRYIIDEATYVIENFGPRSPGSAGEYKTQQHIKDTLARYSDSAPVIESFQVAPHAFLGGQQVIPSLLVLLATMVFWWSPLASTFLSGLAVTIVYQELFRYIRFLDPFFPKRSSHNVYAARKPKGEIKRRIILNGHADATHEWFIHYHAPGLFKILIPLSLLGLLLKCATDIIVLLLGGGISGDLGMLWQVCGMIQLVIAPTALVGLLMTSPRVVPGANDNLSGTFSAVGLFKTLHDAGVNLENTELGVLITGSEEAGLRGAKAWCEKHAQDYSDVETIFVVMDTMGELKHLKVYNRDLNATVPLDEEVCTLLQNAMQQCGYDQPYGSIFLGASDGAAFAQGGLRVATMAAMDPAPAHYYHTRLDHWSIMCPQALEATLRVIITALETYDQQGLSNTEK